MRDWSWMKRFHTLPLAGGLLDQDPRFLEAVDFIESEAEMIRDALK